MFQQKSIKDIVDEIYQDIVNGKIIFANENQFQFELAWRIKNEYKNYDVIFEAVYLDNTGKKCYTDLVVLDKNNKKYTPIELKYKTKSRYKNDLLLKNQDAQGLAAYDYLMDLMRIEFLQQNPQQQLKFYEYYDNNQSYSFDTGYAIMFTNDKSYYNGDWINNQARDFSIKEGLNKTGTLNWNLKINKVNNFGKNRQNSIILKNNYLCEWAPKIAINNNNYFRYLILEV